MEKLNLSKEEFKRRHRAARYAAADCGGNIWAMAQAGNLPESLFRSYLLNKYERGGDPSTLSLFCDGTGPRSHQRGSRDLRVAGPKGTLP